MDTDTVPTRTRTRGTIDGPASVSVESGFPPPKLWFQLSHFSDVFSTHDRFGVKGRTALGPTDQKRTPLCLPVLCKILVTPWISTHDNPEPETVSCDTGPRLIFLSQTILIVLTYYASFLLRLDANLDAANRAFVLEDPALGRWHQAGAGLSVWTDARLVALRGHE